MNMSSDVGLPAEVGGGCALFSGGQGRVAASGVPHPLAEVIRGLEEAEPVATH